jgi:hypothetical protein
MILKYEDGYSPCYECFNNGRKDKRRDKGNRKTRKKT